MNATEEIYIDSALDGWDWTALGVAAVLAAIVALTALVSAPNTWDAMEYHLPRVVQWMGNQGVQLYPTIDRQQLTMPPMSEYFMLHLDLLYGSDRLVNLVQWFAYMGCILGVSLLVEELGGNRRAQAFAAVLGATIPAAMLGASGAKNDNVLACWIVLAVYLLITWRRKQNWWLALAIGASISLAIFTKGTAYIFLPCLVLACWMMYDAKARRRFALSLPLFMLLFLSVNGPLWLRNYNLSGSVLGLPYFDGVGSIEGRKFANSHLSPGQALAGLARNISINLSVPSNTANEVTTRLCHYFIRKIGVDPDDYGQLYRAQSGHAWPFQVQWHYRDEELTGNQWNFLLLLVAGVLYVVHWRTRNKQHGWLASGLIGALIMFSALLRWGPWNGKYQFPIFTVSVVFVALVLVQFLSRKTIRVAMFLSLILAVPEATMNSMRPWVNLHEHAETLSALPRDRTYFLDKHQYLAESFIQAAQAPEVKDCRFVGIDATLLHFEYPMMALIKEGSTEHRFQYLSVTNPTIAYGKADIPVPCVVVCLGCAGSAEKLHKYGENPRTESFGEVVIFSNNGNPVAYRESANPGSL
ncbi:MAG: glycosyltransferase family 39 protein [Terracidiphilus sp.]